MQKTHPHKTLRDIWPNLELFIHGGVSFAPYRELFHKFIPFSDMNYLEVYNASEGFFAFQDDPKKQGEMLLLTHHGIFYEFINMTDYGRPSAKAIPLSEVKVGIHYAMIITTNAGLWRYDIGDTVCFTSIQPYRIKISGRTKHHINIVGEELMVGNTDHAVSVLSEKYNILIYDYTVGPIFMDSSGKAGHEWIIEAEKPVDMTVFQNELDKILCEINSDYQAKRQDNIVLQKPILHFVKKGTFMKWMEQRGKVGGQHKVPRLSNMRHYIDQILAI